MKKLILSAAFASTAFNAFADNLPAVKYPPGTSPSAIAANEQVRMEIAGKPGVEYCRIIDTQDPRGRCLDSRILNGGGGSAAGSPGNGAPGAGGPGGPGF